VYVVVAEGDTPVGFCVEEVKPAGEDVQEYVRGQVVDANEILQELSVPISSVASSATLNTQVPDADPVKIENASCGANVPLTVEFPVGSAAPPV